MLCSLICVCVNNLTLYSHSSFLAQNVDIFSQFEYTTYLENSRNDNEYAEFGVYKCCLIDFNKKPVLVCYQGYCESNVFDVYTTIAKMIVNRLSAHLDAWAKIGTNDMVMTWLKHGVPIAFKTPQKSYSMSNPKFTLKQAVFIRSELTKLKSKGYIVKSVNKPFVVSPLNVVPKKGGKSRLIHNLRKLNENVELKTFKNEDIRVAIDMIDTHDYMTSLDLRDCFFQIPVERKSQQYLGFSFEGQFYYWTVLPFGLNLSPFYCSKVIRPIINFLRYEHKLKIMVYVDDFLCVGSKDIITSSTDTMIHTLEELGWLINHEKSCFVPSKEIDYIGFNINSCGVKQCPEIWVTASRVRKLKHSIARLLGRGQCTARDLARVSGQCISMSLAVKYGKCMLRGVYSLLRTRSDWDCMLVLDADSIVDLKWWQTEMCSPRKRTLYKRPIDAHLYIDASSSGWGATCDDLEAAGLWNNRLHYKCSNFRELTAIFVGLLSFKHYLSGKCIQIYTDNITAKAYLLHQGGPLKPYNDVTKAIWCLISKYQMEISCLHIAGVENIKADYLSRIVDPHNWTLNKDIFHVIDRMLGPHSIDRFANWTNHLLPKYNSMYWDPGTSGVNAMAQRDWNKEMNYCAPPFSMINSVLDLVIQQRAKMTLIAPIWKGASWMLKLRKMCVQEPIILPQNGHTFQRVNMWAPVPEPLRNARWRVGVWNVHGDRA